MSQNWLVIHFKDENTVEAIPKQWYVYDSNECFWPSVTHNRQKINDLIKNQASPECDWKIYSATVLGEYDTYEKAQKKANKAMYTDRLSSSNNEEVFLTKRKRITMSRRYSSSDDSDEYPTVPKPPSAIQKNKNSPIGATPTRRDIHSIISNTSRNDHPTTSSSEISEDRSTYNAIALHNSSTTMDEFIKKSEEFHRQVMRQLFIINSKLNQYSDNLNTLLSVQNVRDTEEKYNSEEIQILIKGMPLQNQEKLDEIERYLNTENKIKSLAKELSRIGGDSTKEITKRIMYTMLSNEIGIAYSWEGAKGKKMFKTLNIASVIINAVRYNKRTSMAQDDEIIKVIKAWLLRAKDRFDNNLKRNTPQANRHEKDA